MNKKSDIKDIKLFLLDMDGTIYIGDELFDGAAEDMFFLQTIRQKVRINI